MYGMHNKVQEIKKKTRQNVTMNLLGFWLAQREDQSGKRDDEVV